ncbi:MAG TPA: anti-sigma regulatory factor [Firmicutes bacterium]|nr:anti-sigma regulatory factor [Bacillota bacterium]
MRFPVQGNDFMQAGDASSKIKRALQQIGMESSLVRRAAIASYEAEMNIVIHAHHGELILTIWPNLIQIVAADVGPGISDIDLAMQVGYSTAPESVRQMGFGAGMGLPNMQKCADEMQVETKVGEGTRIVVKINL